MLTSRFDAIAHCVEQGASAKAGGVARTDCLPWVRASISFNQCEEWAAMEYVANPCSAPRERKEMTAGVRSAWRIMVYSRVYLKICEGCGGLWFRTQEESNVYCGLCERRLRGHSRETKRRPGRPRKHSIAVAEAGGTR